MKKIRMAAILTGLVAAGLVFGEESLPGETTVTSPVPDQVFAVGTSAIPCAWMPTDFAETYDLNLLKPGNKSFSASGLDGTGGQLNGSFSPGYYTLFVRGSNTVGAGPWSTGVTFIVRRKMTPAGAVFKGKPPSLFKWTRSEPATAYLLKFARYDTAAGKFKTVQSFWVPQPAAGDIKWISRVYIPDGRFRWSVTDYKKKVAGYTQMAYFTVKKTGIKAWNDPVKIIGKWKVTTPWRWVEMTFLADGTVVNKQGDGTEFRRARWYVQDGKFVMVSDVVEVCSYVVTDTTFSFTLPSGNVKKLVRIQ